MSRHVIAIEGKPTLLPDTVLEPGSLWMESDQRIYVTSNFDWQNTPIGYATDFLRNEETGEVSVEIHFLDENYEVDKKLYDVTFWADQLEEDHVKATNDHPKVRLIHKARVRGISIVDSEASKVAASRSQELHGA